MTKRKHSLLSKKIDIILLILFPIFATLISLTIRANYFVSTVLFFVIPAIYFSLRTPNAIKKVMSLAIMSYSEFFFDDRK